MLGDAATQGKRWIENETSSSHYSISFLVPTVCSYLRTDVVPAFTREGFDVPIIIPVSEDRFSLRLSPS